MVHHLFTFFPCLRELPHRFMGNKQCWGYVSDAFDWGQFGGTLKTGNESLINFEQLLIPCCHVRPPPDTAFSLFRTQPQSALACGNLLDGILITCYKIRSWQRWIFFVTSPFWWTSRPWHPCLFPVLPAASSLSIQQLDSFTNGPRLALVAVTMFDHEVQASSS